ncbi:MAG: methyl-accepting chemotaxis protein [Candidatus Calescibacterium sp.]|jgi:methyl-accepting chemotaxis protein|nr:methyl-accepting chemotaxis protein [Candidatus Calescibacterium sp.]
MRLNSIRVKLIFFFGLGIITIFLAIGFIVFINFREMFKKQIVQKGQQISEFFRNHSSITYGFIQEDKVLLGEVIDLFMGNEDVVFAGAINRNGEIITYKTKDEKISQDLIWFIRNLTKSENSIRYDSTQNILSKKTITGDEVILFLNPVMIQKQTFPALAEGKNEEKEFKGFTVLAVSMRNFDVEFWSKIIRIGSLALFLTLVSAIIFMIILNNLILPLNKVRDISKKIADDLDLTEKPISDSSDEIGEISMSFAKMVDILRAELEEIKRLSGILVSIVKDINKMTEKIKQNSDKQEKEIEMVSESTESVYELVQDVVRFLEDLASIITYVIQGVENTEKKLSETKSEAERILKDSENIHRIIENVVRSLKTIKTILESENIYSDLSKISDVKAEIEGKLEDIQNKLKKCEESATVITESGENIRAQNDSLADSISRITSAKSKTLKSLKESLEIIEKLTEDISDLIDHMDDMNILSVNVHIAISHEEAQTEIGKEFKVIAGEIKELSKRAEEKLKNLVNEIRNLNRIILYAAEVIKNEVEEPINTLDKTRNTIENNVTKIIVHSEETKRELKEAQKEGNEAISQFQEAFMKVRKIIQDVQKMHHIAKSCSNEVLFSYDDLKEIKNNTSKLITLMSDELDNIKTLFHNISHSYEMIGRVRRKLKEGSKSVDIARKSAVELSGTTEEIRRIITILKARADNILGIADKLGKMTQRFKLSP